MKFDIYKTWYDKEYKVNKKYYKSKGVKDCYSDNNRAAIGRVVMSGLEDDYDKCNMALVLLHDEQYLNRRHILFPQSKSFWETLVKSKSDGGAVSKIEFPLNHFSYAVPKGFTHKGIAVPPASITRPTNETISLKITSVSNLINSGALFSFGVNDLDDIMNSKGEIFDNPQHVNYKEDECSVLMRTKVDETQLQTIIDFYTRLYAATLLYYSATNGEGIKPGLPKDYQASTGSPKMKSTFTIGRDHDQTEYRPSPTSHIRSFHFRNLRAERYYKGEHEGKEPGSRWTFVRSAMINAKPYTVEELN